MNLDDMVKRWESAKIARSGNKWAVHVKCNGDPREEVLALLKGLAAVEDIADRPMPVIEAVAVPRKRKAKS